MAQIEKRMMKRKICQFNGRSKYWKYWSEEAFEFILLPKDLGEYKEEEVQVSNGRYGPHSSWSCFCVFAKRRKSVRYRF
jgi:DNA topoisomerase-1